MIDNAGVEKVEKCGCWARPSDVALTTVDINGNKQLSGHRNPATAFVVACAVRSLQWKEMWSSFQGAKAENASADQNTKRRRSPVPAPAMCTLGDKSTGTTEEVPESRKPLMEDRNLALKT